MQEKYLQACIAKLPTAAYTCNSEGLLTGYNTHAEQLWGRSPDLNSGKERYCGAFRILASDGTPLRHEDSCMARALRSGKECPGEETILQRENGQRIHVLVNATPFQDQWGHVTGGIGVLTDIEPQIEFRRGLEKKLLEHQRTEQLIHEFNEKEQHVAMHFLHEDIGQRLTGIALLAGVLQKSLAKEGHVLAKKAGEVSKLTGGCIAVASDLAKSYYPLNIQADGLMVSVEFLAQRTASHYKVSCQCLRNEGFKVIPRQAIHIYRMVQIAILNAIQNHGAETIFIAFSTGAEKNAVTITHDMAKPNLAPRVRSAAEIDLLNSRARLVGASVHNIREDKTRQVVISWAH